MAGTSVAPGGRTSPVDTTLEQQQARDTRTDETDLDL